jgi:hypothetical protein
VTNLLHGKTRQRFHTVIDELPWYLTLAILGVDNVPVLLLAFADLILSKPAEEQSGAQTLEGLRSIRKLHRGTSTS